MIYVDDNGNVLNIRTELNDAFDKLYDELDKMTPEERMACVRRAVKIHAGNRQYNLYSAYQLQEKCRFNYL